MLLVSDFHCLYNFRGHRGVRHKYRILEKFESRWPYLINRIFPDESETRFLLRFLNTQETANRFPPIHMRIGETARFLAGFQGRILILVHRALLPHMKDGEDFSVLTVRLATERPGDVRSFT